MTSCDYCERKEPEHIIWWCEGCGARVCTNHSSTRLPNLLLCDPPKDGPNQQRGCYKPPVAEVACVACDKPTSDLHADAPIHVECRPRAPCTIRDACLRADLCLGACS